MVGIVTCFISRPLISCIHFVDILDTLETVDHEGKSFLDIFEWRNEYITSSVCLSICRPSSLINDVNSMKLNQFFSTIGIDFAAT